MRRIRLRWSVRGGSSLTRKQQAQASTPAHRRALPLSPLSLLLLTGGACREKTPYNEMRRFSQLTGDDESPHHNPTDTPPHTQCKSLSTAMKLSDRCCCVLQESSRLRTEHEDGPRRAGRLNSLRRLRHLLQNRIRPRASQSISLKARRPCRSRRSCGRSRRSRDGRACLMASAPAVEVEVEEVVAQSCRRRVSRRRDRHSRQALALAVSTSTRPNSIRPSTATTPSSRSMAASNPSQVPAEALTPL